MAFKEQPTIELGESVEAKIAQLYDAISGDLAQIERAIGSDALSPEQQQKLTKTALGASQEMLAEVAENDPEHHKRDVLRALWQWYAYATRLLHGPDPQGALRDADHVIVQAFGRDHVPDEDLFRIGGLAMRYNDAELVQKIAQTGFEPGPPNAALARQMRGIMEEYNIPAFAQWEVTVAAYLDNEEWAREAIANGDLVSVWPPHRKQARFDTVAVTQDAQRFAGERNLSLPVDLAHMAMLARAFLVTKDVYGREPVIPEEQVGGWDSQSIQGQIRGPAMWVPREILARAYYLLLARKSVKQQRNDAQ